MEIVVNSLEKRGSGIHASELRSRLPNMPGLTAEAVFSLSSLDPRLRVSVGQYLYLSEWGGPRRETISEAVTTILEQASGPIAFNKIVELVQSRLGRTCERTAISGCLAGLGASFDQSGCWAMLRDANPEHEPFEQDA